MNAVFALFPDETRAREAINEVMSHQEIAPDIKGVIAHGGSRRGFRAREFAETDARPALRNSLIVSIVGGALLGVILSGPFDLISGGIVYGAIIGAVLGAVFGVFGAIVGAGRLNRSLGGLAKNLEPGQMLVTFKVSHKETEPVIREIVQRFGARVEGDDLPKASAA